MAEAHQLRRLRELIAGRRFVVISDVAVAAAAHADRLRAVGVDDVLVIGGSRGTGELAPDVERDAIDLGLRAPGGGIMASVRAFEDLLDQPPTALVDAVEAFDPAGDAWVLASMFGQRQRLLGRDVFGARLPTWRALEDKTTVDELWDAAGVVRAPSRVVPSEPAALRTAARELDAGAGTAWVADNRLGWHGGGDYLRWVRGEADADAATALMAATADRVRVMPFLDGLPCAIHGWVIGDEVIVLEPVEMVVLRVRGEARLRYAGPATTWRPAVADRDDMRQTACRVGALLRERTGYRGVFTVDGVLTAGGFRPTELNPRFGAGVGALARGTDLPLYLLHCATVEAPDLDWRPPELERWILDAAADSPLASAHILVGERVTSTRTLPMVHADGQVRPAREDEEPTGRLELGPSPGGGLLRATFNDLAPGAPVAPLAALAFALGSEAFGLELPELAPAPDLARR